MGSIGFEEGQTACSLVFEVYTHKGEGGALSLSENRLPLFLI